MIIEIVWRRMLYVGIGLITAVAAILAFVASYSALPEPAVTPTWVFSIIHLLIVVALIWTIKVNNRGGKINKELLVASGVIPLVLSFMMIDGAFAYIDDPDMHSIGILLFICVGCNFFAGLLALIARYSRKSRPLSK